MKSITQFKQSNGQKHAQSCAPVVHHLQSLERHCLAPREGQCGCAHVYVWDISNDERMLFQVWARGASTPCSILFAICTHPSWCMHVGHIILQTFVIHFTLCCTATFVHNVHHKAKHCLQNLSHHEGSYSYCM